MKILSSIPTHMLTGFLGVGKTSVIIELLKQKPKHETWAVLVNEFGELGIDGSLFKAQLNQQQGIFIQEIPGGCMCCSAALSMQVSLNSLLKRARPDRLIIEPSGIGHPLQVRKALNASHYQGVLDYQGTLTVLDARQLSDPRYLANDIYQQQLSIANLIVANKSELYQTQDKAALNLLKTNLPHLKNTEIEWIERAQLPLSRFLDSTEKKSTVSHAHSSILTPTQNTSLASAQINKPLEVPERESTVSSSSKQNDYVKKQAQQGEMQSIAWHFKSHLIFDAKAFEQLLAATQSVRLKALIQTNQGLLLVNRVQVQLGVNEGELSYQRAQDQGTQSQIEFIYNTGQEPPVNTEQLLACLCHGQSSSNITSI